MISVIIPAAGVGTRLRPHTHAMPKALLPVAGRPILGHILDRLADLPELGAVRVVIGFRGDQVEQYCRTNFDYEFHFVWQQQQRGLGHAIHLALADIPDRDQVIVILGDTILEVDLAAFLKSGANVLGVKAVDDPRRFGVVELNSDGTSVKRVVEKPTVPPSRLAVVGLYAIADTARLRLALDRVVAENETTAGEIQMTDALQYLIESGGSLRAATVDGWFDCGKFETLLQTNRYLLDKLATRYDINGSVVVSPCYIAPTAVIERCVIGPHVAIGRGATITDSVIADSIVDENAQVSRSVLRESIIGAGAVVNGQAQRLNIGGESGVALT